MSDRDDPRTVEEAADRRLSPAAQSDVATVAKGGAVQIAGQMSQRGLSYVFGAVFTILLGTPAYGLYRSISQVLANVSQLGLAGFNYAAMRFIARARAAGDPAGVRGAARVALIATAATSLVVAAVFLLFTQPLANLFTENDGRGGEAEFLRLLRIGAPYIPLFALLQTLRYCTQGYKTMVPSVVAGNIVQPVVRFVLGVAAVVVGLGVAGAVVSLTISIAAAAAVAAWWFMRLLTPEERGTPPHADARAMFRFALPQGGASLLGIQTLGLGILILQAVDTNQVVGFFAVALALQGPGNLFLGGIVNIWAPVVSELHGKGEIDRLDSLYKTINRWIATFSFPVFVALLVEPDFFTKFYGSTAAGAASAVAILAIGNFFYTGTGPTGYVISMSGHPTINLINSAVGVALYLVLGIWAARTHGLVGMAWVDTGVTALINVARVIEAKALVGVQPFGKSFLKPVLASIAGGAVLLAWRLVPGDSTVVEIAGIVAAGAAYVLALKLQGLDEEEAYVLRRIKKRMLRRGR